MAAIRDLGERPRAAPSLDSLRGIEGAAAARYFELLPRTVPEHFAFSGRSRRPPKDPFNALISFGYVLAGNERLTDTEEDTVRIYRLCATCEERVEILGRGVRSEDPDVYIV